MSYKIRLYTTHAQFKFPFQQEECKQCKCAAGSPNVPHISPVDEVLLSTSVSELASDVDPRLDRSNAKGLLFGGGVFIVQPNVGCK